MVQELVEDRKETARHHITARGPGMARRRAEEDLSLTCVLISHEGTYV